MKTLGLPELYLSMTVTLTVLCVHFWGRVVSVCYITLAGGLEKCNVVLHRVGGWYKKTIFGVI